MPRFLYFAYGSNLLAERLAARCPSANPLGPATLAGRRLVFEAKSFDGSGKATLVAGADGDVVHGRLYDIDLADRPALDRAEGTDQDPPIYRRRDDLEVLGADGLPVTGVSVYLARETTALLPPWDWYRALIVAGGMQAGLPAGHVAALAVTPALADVLPQRKTRRAALEILRAAGFPELARACATDEEADAPSPSLDEVAERAVAEAIAYV